MIMDALKAAKIMNGTAKGMPGELVFTGVSTDTRTIKSGDMFIAIKGENFNGADFIEKAFTNGASCAVTSVENNDPRVIVVEDTIIALGKLAKSHCESINKPIIAVTGSVGKTTVKNMLISVFSQKYNVHYTEGNKNNHIGLPMTLMKLNKNHDLSILEMGMSGLGEIDYLSSLANPDYAIITNIGMSHIGMLGSKENILKAKTEIMNHLKPGGKVIINGDDELLFNLIAPEGADLIKYGISTSNDYIAHNANTNEFGNCLFKSNGTEFELPVPGNHNVANAMAAVALARIYGIDEMLIKKGLLNFKQSKMRMHRFKKNGINYINDAYNANPQSMRAALDILDGAAGRKIAVLGDMLEMGGFSEEAHIKLGEYAAEIADILMLCGKEAAQMKLGALSSGFKCSVTTFGTSDEAGPILQKTAQKGDTVLIKGSRGMKMENVLEYTEDGGQK